MRWPSVCSSPPVFGSSRSPSNKGLSGIVRRSFCPDLRPGQMLRVFSVQFAGYFRGLPTRCAVANIKATVSKSFGCTFPGGMRV
jgi:hypothetical protein